ncbi:MAG TPA: hypothetical protein VHL80_13200 [Polyangia bacterium]|nr:hypothetical protein [Polyangia bacterium]
MKLFAAGADPAELRRCVEDGLCEGAALLGALDSSPEGQARLVALGQVGAGPILVDVAAPGEPAALASLGSRFAARVGAPSAADPDLLRKARALLRAFRAGAALLVGPLRDAGTLFDASVMGAEAALVEPAVLRQLAARRSGAAAGS